MSFEEQQKEKILKSYNGTDDMLKKSEGSRGGKVIGHTKSGKPVYEDHKRSDHSDYENFNAKDHKEASQLHYDIARKLQDGKGHYDHDEKTRFKITHHDMAASSHSVTSNWLNQAHGGGIAPKQTESEKKAAEKKEFRNASRRDRNTPV